MRSLRGNRRAALIAAALAAVGLVTAALLIFTGGAKPIDNTPVGGTLTSERLHQVLGHLFDGVRTVHVRFTSTGAPGPKREADLILGPPVQAKVTLTTTTAPPQVGTVIIKDNKSYLHVPSLGSKWVLMSSANDGVSGTPGLSQTGFELALLGQHTVGTYKGPATIDGIATRQYALNATPSATPSAGPSPTTPSTATAPRLIATVWIDGSGRMIQFSYSPTGQGDWVTATYSNWGEAVTVQAPPEKDITVLQGVM